MRQNHLECDGCGRETHEDDVRIVGDRVLCSRCRRQGETAFFRPKGAVAAKPGPETRIQ